MNRMFSSHPDIDVIGKLADLKEDHYKNMLILSAVLDLLIEKGMLTPEEIQAKAWELDASLPTPTHPIS
jgi:hypothetical protein